jgi:hypothetical protein
VNVTAHTAAAIVAVAVTVTAHTAPVGFSCHSVYNTKSNACCSWLTPYI